MVAAGLTLACLLVLLPSQGSAGTATMGLGFMTSIFANVTVRDPERAQQALTLSLLAGPAVIFSALAAFLRPWPWIAEPVFVLVVVGAILARLIGPRGLALGMVAYIAYFICLIIKPPLAQWPQLAAGIFVGLASTALVRFLILPDRPRSAFRWAVGQTRHRTGRLLAEAEKLLDVDFESVAELRNDPHWRRIHRQIGQMHDATLLAEEQLATFEEAGDEDGPVATRALFDVELAIERLVQAIGHHPPPQPERGDIKARTTLLRERLARDGAGRETERDGRPADVRRGPVRLALGVLEDKVVRLCAARREGVAKGGDRAS